jgi:hypothetical protein
VPSGFAITLLVYVALPVFVGIVLGANQTRAGAQLPWIFSIIYWIALSVSTWWLMAGGTLVLARILKPWSPPSWLVWLLGGIAGSFIARPAIYQLASWFKPWMDGGELRSMRPIEFSSDFAVYYIVNWSVILLMWMAAQFVFSYANARSNLNLETNIPLADQHAGDGVADTETASPPYSGFLERIPIHLGKDVIALHSEDHYLRVFTRKGDALILVTISEAIRTLDAARIKGLQVHRSWWVQLNAVSKTQLSNRKMIAVLDTGLEVPVSQTYRALYERAKIVLENEKSLHPDGL